MNISTKCQLISYTHKLLVNVMLGLNNNLSSFNLTSYINYRGNFLFPSQSWTRALLAFAFIKIRMYECSRKRNDKRGEVRLIEMNTVQTFKTKKKEYVMLLRYWCFFTPEFFRRHIKPCVIDMWTEIRNLLFTHSIFYLISGNIFSFRRHLTAMPKK